MSNLRGLSEGEHKLLANVAMLVPLYGAPVWADAINAREYRRTEMVLVQWKAALRCVSAYHTVSTEALCVLAGIPLIKIVAVVRKKVYSTMLSRSLVTMTSLVRLFMVLLIIDKFSY